MKQQTIEEALSSLIFRCCRSYQSKHKELGQKLKRLRIEFYRGEK